MTSTLMRRHEHPSVKAPEMVSYGLTYLQGLEVSKGVSEDREKLEGIFVVHGPPTCSPGLYKEIKRGSCSVDVEYT
ncbi:uncharacterized protein E5676_scaffold3734G00480 [Cucumis melo var. makuwa]|uniref:Uncharacterized protein n=1 Tax=Cucumis melo var. makuwa TaxID=1194695 RepID=A0A5A7UHM6_CUCMM|nr:uncharacterized protein E6C27_scaffold24G004530 [Cucumis melo var. makuwa]TYK08618.1 uncharacterized protein E5676_scaffold3734G00480 [Cucumis melo var. makuwa]